MRWRIIRPFPKAELLRALSGRRAVGVIDQNLSPGLNGVLYHEIAATLGAAQHRPVLRSFIGGLGGKDISPSELEHIWETLESSQPSREPVEPDLLMTESERRQVQQRLTFAGKSNPEPVP